MYWIIKVTNFFMFCSINIVDCGTGCCYVLPALSSFIDFMCFKKHKLVIKEQDVGELVSHWGLTITSWRALLFRQGSDYSILASYTSLSETDSQWLKENMFSSCQWRFLLVANSSQHFSFKAAKTCLDGLRHTDLAQWLWVVSSTRTKMDTANSRV